jgi:methionyl-tRNA synthetase
MSPRLLSICEQAVAAGLSDIAVTQAGNWGIPVPIPGFEGQRILAWCEEVAFCLTYPLCLGSHWEDYWKSEHTSVVQCFGFDNSFYQAVLAPALLMAFDSGIRLPSALLMNELYLLNGEKFSTSRGHAIWGRDLLADVPADILRFYLATTYPERERTSFRQIELAETVDEELLGHWQCWLVQLAARMGSEFDDWVPVAGGWLEEHRSFYGRLEALTAEAAHAYDARSFSPQRVARILGQLVRESQTFARGEQCWTEVANRSGERGTAMALELLAAKQLAVLSSPVLPDFAERLWLALGYVTPLAQHRWEEHPSWVPGGQRLCGLASASGFRSVRQALEKRDYSVGRALRPEAPGSP